VRRAALVALVVFAGCGTNPQDRVTRVQTFASHVEQVATSARAAARNHDERALDELLDEARLAQEDIESTVPLDAPGREPALRRAREVVESVSLALEREQR
jgi:vacuolar-type H+-ATPase subunit E/Vma4